LRAASKYEAESPFRLAFDFRAGTIPSELPGVTGIAGQFDLQGRSRMETAADARLFAGRNCCPFD